jgi:hypothetical protein
MSNRTPPIIQMIKDQADRVRLFFTLTLGYAVFNVANHYATESLYFETGAHLIHLPSGVRMVLVLVGGSTGAAAISVATFPYAYLVLFKDNLELSIVISLTSSLIPLATLVIARKLIHWQSHFADLTPRKLLVISVAYATTNATVQQFIYYLFDIASRPINAWLVMFTGDILGILIVLYVLRIIGKSLKSRSGT